MRILHVLDKIDVGSGVSSVVMNYYSKMPSDIIFDFMLNEDVDSDTRMYIEGKGSKIYIMPALKAKNLFKYIHELRIFYKNTDYKIVHGHVANSAVFYLGLAKGVPVKIIHSHNTKSADVWWKRVRNGILNSFIKTVANRYMACSESASRFLFGTLEEVMILHNAINVDRFSHDSDTRKKVRKKLGIEDRLVIGHIGRFSGQKNHYFMIDAFKDLYRENSNTTLMLIGEGELRGEIEKKSNNLPILFLGVCKDVQNYMNAMDVFILPSMFEGLPLVAVEAQASGLPCILSDKVPKAVDVTGNVKFLELDKAVWVQELTSVSISDRTKQGQKVIGSRFDIVTQSERLVEYYRLSQQREC